MLTNFRKKLLNNFYRKDVKNKVSYLRKHQWDNPEEHKKHQLEQLAETLVSACKVPYYSPFLSGVDINSDPLGALHRIPIVDKKVILDNPSQFVNPTIKSVGRGTSSGTTGVMSSFLYDETLLENAETLTRFYRSWFGIESGDKGLKVWGRPIKGLKSKIHLELSNFLRGMKTVNPLDLSLASLEKNWKIIIRFKPKYFYGYSTSIAFLAKWIRRLKYEDSAKALKLNAIICTSETLLESDKKLIKDVFECPVIEEYGAAETSIIAHECSSGNFHISSESLYIECVDDDGVSVTPGTPGHLIITPFFNRVSPLIRYRIGDYGTLLDSSCPCGRGSPIMELNVARTIELIRTKGGKFFSATIIDYIIFALMQDPKNGIRQFRVTQKKIDTFLIEIVSDGNFSEQSKVNFTNLLKNQLGEKELVTIFEVKEKLKPLPSGKLLSFISELD